MVHFSLSDLCFAVYNSKALKYKKLLSQHRYHVWKHTVTFSSFIRSAPTLQRVSSLHTLFAQHLHYCWKKWNKFFCDSKEHLWFSCTASHSSGPLPSNSHETSISPVSDTNAQNPHIISKEMESDQKKKKFQTSIYKRKKVFLIGRSCITTIPHPRDKSLRGHVTLKESGGQQEAPAVLQLCPPIIFPTATVHAHSPLLSGSHLKRAPLLPAPFP